MAINLLNGWGNVQTVVHEPDGRIVEKAANPKHGVKSKEAAGKVQKLDNVKHESTLEF